MTPQANLDALSADLLALQAVVRALARLQARRSPTALAALLQALCEETGRLSEDLAVYDDRGRQQASTAAAVVGAWVEDFKEEAAAA